jgi:hypothetical protein
MHTTFLALPDITFLPKEGALHTILYSTYIKVQVDGFPNPPMMLTLIDLIILTFLAIAINGIVERLTGRKGHPILLAILFTILGSALTIAFMRLPFDFELEGERIISPLEGGIVSAVFYSLLRFPRPTRGLQAAGGGH